MRDVLIYLAIKYEGDYVKIINAVERKWFPNKEEVEEGIAKLKCKVVTILDEDYPAKLKHIAKPPMVLFYYGDLKLIKGKMISVIGSRNCSSAGERWTNYFVKELVSKRVVIVSGLAKGVDGKAHQAAIESKGQTIAVLGSGIDYCYPYENKNLYEMIKKNHLVMSEYPFDTKPNKKNFPMRNRIVAGLSDCLLVTEAAEASGTMITVTCALEQGKDVYCVPSMETKYRGCNYLIKQGAYLADNVDDIELK